MKRLALLFSFCLSLAPFAWSQNFGEFASAIYVTDCSGSSFYNTTGSDPNCINTNCATVFNGANFGPFGQGTGELLLAGAEIKTWKNAGGNACGATLHYRVYPAGSPSGGFSTLNIPFNANCCAGTFCDGLGPCGGNDQKWTETTASIDLTSNAPGFYEIEAYISYFGDDFSSSGCGITKFVNNGGANFIASFEIAATGSCAVLAADLHHMNTTCIGDETTVMAELTPDQGTERIAIERKDGMSWTEVYTTETLAGYGSPITLQYSETNLGVAYYRLVEYEYDGDRIVLQTIAAECQPEDDFFISQGPTGEFYLTVNGLEKDTQLDLAIYDAQGKLIGVNSIQHYASSSALHEVNTDGCATGFYLVSVMQDNEIVKNLRFIHP